MKSLILQHFGHFRLPKMTSKLSNSGSIHPPLGAFENGQATESLFTAFPTARPRSNHY